MYISEYLAHVWIAFSLPRTRDQLTEFLRKEQAKITFYGFCPKHKGGNMKRLSV